MKYKNLLNILEENKNKVLRFEYETGQFVEKNFHITEVKNLQIKSVDCGGKSDQWNETVLQLWNPANPAERYPMKGQKALNILNIVDNEIKIDRESEVLFEYGNATNRVSNYAIGQIIEEESDLTIVFEGVKTQCKASSERTLETAPCCGVPSEGKLEASCC